jgi:hypothetical protein
LQSFTTYYYIPFVNVDGKYYYDQKVDSFKTDITETDPVNLGMHVLWTRCNIGASLPEEMGGLYAWGETNTKNIYSNDTYFDNSYVIISTSKGNGVISGTERDVAFKTLGSDWRMPTSTEIQYLSNLPSILTNYKGVNGRVYRGGTGNTIFVPNNSDGELWSGSLGASDGFSNILENDGTIKTKERYIGIPVRGVKEIKEVPVLAMIDLGLTSGTKWANKNIGSEWPDDYGNYYAWGETETKEVYSSSNCKWYGITYSSLQQQGVVDSNGNLTSAYDVAHVKWGGSWRIPTQVEAQELLDECKWIWTSENGIYGYQVIGPNGNSIFIPCAGRKNNTTHYGKNTYGNYFSATCDKEDSDKAFNLIFDDEYKKMWSGSREGGRSIRPVSN